jgi:GLPGLI family protein
MLNRSLFLSFSLFLSMNVFCQIEHKINFSNKTLVYTNVDSDSTGTGVEGVNVELETTMELLANDTSSFMKIINTKSNSRLAVNIESYKYSRKFIVNSSSILCTGSGDSCSRTKLSTVQYQLTGKEKKIAGYDCVEANLLKDNNATIWICKKMPYTITCSNFVLNDKSGGILSYQKGSFSTIATSVGVNNKSSTFLSEYNIKE